MHTIKDRLIEFLAYLKIGQGKFEKKCDLSNGTVNNIKEGGITTQKVEKILLAYPNLNIDWLITGRGEMLKSNLAAYDNQSISNLQPSPPSVDEENKSLQKKVISLMEENMALQKKVISLMEENKKLNDYDSDDDNTDRLGMYQKMLEERIEKLRRNKKRTDSA